MRIRIIGILFLTFIPFKAVAQQIPLFSQYMLNGFTFNSAMAGYDGFTSFNLNSRQQWLGYTNAPRTFVFSAQTRLLKRSYMIKVKPRRSNKFIGARSGRIGLGASIFNDRNGAFMQTGASLNYAYHISFANAQLSMGVSASLIQYNLDRTSLSFRNIENKAGLFEQPAFIPDVQVGTFYINREYMIGFSVANIMQSKIKFGNSNLWEYQNKRQYFIVGGYKFSDYMRLTYEPSFLLKTTDFLFAKAEFKAQIDISYKITYKDRYWGGLSYRTANTVIAFLGLKQNSFYIGYAFDMDFNAFQTTTYGSHELNLALRFGDSAKRYRWINRY